MQDQNVKNHGRYILLWHFITPILLLLILAMCVINLVHSDMTMHDLHKWLPIIFMPVVMLIFWWYIRSFALRAQDRAIRAEENFRHFILTGKPLDSKLSIAQIIALRFAGNDEMPALAKKAVEENLSLKEIKMEIKNWRADNYRV